MPNCTTLRSHLEASEVHNCLDEDGVVADVRVLGIKLGERAEERTAAGDVHLAHWSLEGRGSDIRSKSVDYMLPVALVQQHQSNLEIKQIREIMFTCSEHRVSPVENFGVISRVRVAGSSGKEVEPDLSNESKCTFLVDYFVM